MSAPIKVAAFEAANSRAYLRAVFAAWAAGETVMALPASARDRDIPGLVVARRESFAQDPGWFTDPLPPQDPDANALVAFSSGTTGTPKAILLSHRALGNVVSRINTAMQVDETIREYLGVPVTFSFGFGRARAVAAAGGQSYLPEHGFDPSEIARMLGAGEINAVSAVPTLWRVLLANEEIIPADAASKLKWIEIGSQWMTGAEKLALRQLFPNAKILQHYGLTEASRTALLDISTTPEHRLDSVGRAEGDVEIEVDDEGRIRTRGSHLATGLVKDGGVVPVVGDDGWLTTSDTGRLDEGWLYYTGRSDELINCGGVKIDPTAFEQAVNLTLGEPGAVAAGRVSDPLRGEKILLAYVGDRDQAAIEAAAVKAAEARGLVGRGVFEVRQVDEIPLTPTGKVRRAALADLKDQSRKTGLRDTDGQPVATGKAAELQALWADILGVESVPLDKSFYDLGGDSLSALTAILKMEALGVDTDTARGIFDGRTILDLTGEAGPTAAAPAGGLALTDALNAVHATRGFLAMWVVLVNWLPGILVRIGDDSMSFLDALLPIWRFGTPGFAIVFGVGLGALGLHLYETNRALHLKNTRFNALIVVAGVCVLAAAKLALAARFGLLDHRETLSGLFYSVITYFALAMLLMPLILRMMSIGQNRVLTLLSLAVGAMIIHAVLDAQVSGARPGAFLEFLKLVLVEKYGFFRMTGYVMIGATIGWLLRQYHARPGILGQSACAGVVLMAAGGLGLYQAAPADIAASFSWPNLWHIAIYAGVVVLLLSGFSWLNQKGQVRGVVGWLNAFAMVSGILALPIFIGNELLLVLKALFDSFGLPELLSFAVLLGAFIGGFALLYARLMPLFQRKAS
ncbi:MAG: AMP-binding protein [Pseudomonadota bacterium]